MKPTSDTIDARMVQGIVREVVERLRKPMSAPSPLASSPATSEWFNHRLITVETLGQVGPGQTRILVPTRAIVTPAAADEAKLRNLTIERACSSATPNGSPSAQPSLWLADADRDERAASLVKQLNSRGVNVGGRALADAIEGLVSGAVNTVVVLANLPAVVVCDACRRSQVRAATIRTLDELQRIEPALHPNLWVFDMHQMSLPQAMALADRCVRLSVTGALS